MEKNNVVNFPSKSGLTSAEEFRSKLKESMVISKQRKEVKDKFEELEPRLKRLPQYRGRVPSKNFLRKDPLIEKGQCYWIESENALFTVAKKTSKGIDLRPLDLNASISTGVTIYEMNQMMASREPLMDMTKDLPAAQEQLNEFLAKTDNKFYLLYSRDLHYFTIFERKSADVDIKDLFSYIDYAWDIVSLDVDLTTDEGLEKVEIWVRDLEKSGPSANHMFYLLPFDSYTGTL